MIAIATQTRSIPNESRAVWGDLPYPTGWHVAAYAAARRARTDARRSGASESEARAAGEAAYRWTWHRKTRPETVSNAKNKM